MYPVPSERTQIAAVTTNSSRVIQMLLHRRWRGCFADDRCFGAAVKQALHRHLILTAHSAYCAWDTLISWSMSLLLTALFLPA
jgi:hypothetical protein